MTGSVFKKWQPPTPLKISKKSAFKKWEDRKLLTKLELIEWAKSIKIKIINGKITLT